MTKRSAASTDGVEQQAIEGEAQQPPEEADPAPQSEQPAQPPATLAQLPSAASGMSLPSQDVVHWRVLANEVTIKMAGYDAGLTNLNTELDGVEQRYRADLDELTQRRDKRKNDLLVQIEDIEVARSMVAKALDVADAYIRACNEQAERERQQ